MFLSLVLRVSVCACALHIDLLRPPEPMHWDAQLFNSHMFRKTEIVSSNN